MTVHPETAHADSGPGAAAPAPDEDPEIRAERAYLHRARQALRRMHDQVVDTGTPLSDAEETDEIWHNTVYQLDRARRAQALVDLPDVPLFFGRLDRAPAGEDVPDELPEKIYVGRRHVHDGQGAPLVVDWRAPVSAAFYRASREDPQGVQVRRRYGFSDDAELTAYEDEPLSGPAAAGGGVPGSGTDSALVAAEIERPRAGPMRDIVATIQPDQDALVRAPRQPSLCIQGAPGTGKTAVGLHRLAYLLYTERARLQSAGGVAVVGPNRSFLRYIRRVLPALGEVDVTQATADALIGRPATATEGEETARLKGDARMAEVLHRALWRHVTDPTDDLVYTEGSQRHRVPREDVQRAVDQLRRSTRYGAGRESLPQRLAHLVLVCMERRGGSPDDRDQRRVARSKPVKAVVDQVWPKVTPDQVLYRLWSDADVLAAAADGLFTEAEQELLRWRKPYRSARSATWTAADAVLCDELADLIDRTPTVGHMVVDEAQDLSPMQCRALGRRCRSGTLTVLGDLAQGTSPWAADDWATLLAHLGHQDARVARLTQGFRVPSQILAYAARLLPHIAPELAAPSSVRHQPGALQVTAATADDFGDEVAQACREAAKQEGTVGLVAAADDAPALHRRLVEEGLEAALLADDPAHADAMADARLVCVPATLAKGLEFDTVVVAEPARIVAAERRGLHRLYVVLTRAVSSLHVVHAEPLPAPLATPHEPPGNGAAPNDTEKRSHQTETLV